MFSRNASSSRAIPISKMIEQVEDDPAMPIHWGLNKPGMQAGEETADLDAAKESWLHARIMAVEVAAELADNNIHKQVSNRLLEPFQFISVVVTATEWENFFKLRLHPDAQPEIQELARVMKESMSLVEPEVLDSGWHLPYVDVRDFVKEHSGGNTIDYESAKLCSVARCARVSYLNHDQSDPSIEKDISLAKMLLKSGHMSPFEHQATPFPDGYDWLDIRGLTHIDRNMDHWSGNFKNWIQLRQTL
jgi:hypothetical protein